MKKLGLLLILYLFLNQLSVFSATPFRFAFFSDTHICITNPQASEDLMNAVAEINAKDDVEFVIVGGDVTDKGDSASMLLARKILSGLKIPFYVVPGNHDVHWNQPESIRRFVAVFGDDKFVIHSSGYTFAGFATAPVAKSGKGVSLSADLNWLATKLKSYDDPVIFITHYPLLEGDVEGRNEITGLMKQFKETAVLCGHYHRNAFLNFDEIPGIVNRSIQRNKDAVGGYNLYTVDDFLTVAEKRIGQSEEVWLALPLNP